MSRHTRLSLIPLEDRTTPTTASYAAGTLTLTTGNNNFIEVTMKYFGNNNYIPGYLHVEAGNVQIFESADNQPVNAIIVKNGAGVEDYAFEMFDKVSVGSLTIGGATKMTNISLMDGVHISGDFKFTGVGTAADNVTVQKDSIIGGNATLDFKSGSNSLKLEDGFIGGNLTVLGGAGNDEVDFFNSGDVTVGGSAKFTLGDGDNKIQAIKQGTLSVGKGFTFTGGLGQNRFNFGMLNAELDVGANLTVSFGGMGLPPSDSWYSHTLNVGGSVTFTLGGVGGDSGASLLGATVIGGNLSVAATAPFGLSIGGDSYATTIGGSLKFTGGPADDAAYFDRLQVAKDVTLNLGAGSTGQHVHLGDNQAHPVVVGGNLSITTGAAADDILVLQTTVGKALTISTGGGADKVYIDDTSVTGATLIDLGAGADELHVDTKIANVDLDQLDGYTQFGGNFTVMAGDGDDLVDLSDSGGQHLVVGGITKLVGGIGKDTFKHWTGNIYLGTHTEDFELGEAF
ncbi:MAG TPA: hypothetical protein VHR66_03260 [Gemmataceae bacterium]|jgi:hypothetical protein|nr:hypothetical protein [Gemmataceae bacterium]